MTSPINPLAASSVRGPLADQVTVPAHVPTNMPTDNRPINAGRSMDDNASRLDGIAKVTGAAKFGRDMYLDKSLFVGFIRCPWGAATLKSMNEAAARAVPGVLEIKKTGDVGKYNGHNVGYIVAESKTALRRALRALQPVWERQNVKTQITDSSVQPPEPNAATKELLGQADHVLEAVYSTPVQTHSALETHGVVIDHKGDSAIVYASTQGTFSVRDEIGGPLQLPRAKYEVRCEYVGGGFGAKFGPDKQGMTAAEVAAKYKRPVNLFMDRDEEHLDTGNRPSMRTVVKVGFKKDGTILGGQIHVCGGVGVADRGGDANIPSNRYKLGDIQRSQQNVQFNGGAPRAMRAPGHPQGAFAEELMLDEVATIAGIDPLELRLKLDPNADRREMYRRGAKLIGWNKRMMTGLQSGGGIRRGFGMGSTSWGAFPAEAEAEVIIHRDGSVEARTGTQDIGTGQRTAMGIIVEKNLGVPLRLVDVRIGSSNFPEGPASGGSVTVSNTSVAMAKAALDAKQRMLKSLADRIGGDESEFDIVAPNGDIQRNGQSIMSWKDACQKMAAETVTGRGQKAGRERLPGEGHSHGAQFVELLVDTETGVIRVKKVVAFQSCGTVICRKTAESQIIGGVIQGISYALFENKLLDRQTGAMVNPNMEMYKILGSSDMPHIQPVLWERNQTGVRPLGEPPVIPTAGAVACALYNAVGVPVRDLPLTPDKVLAALDSAKKGGAA
jgi:xanthine dehydrogenase YagR molybdenum-binding subunit